MEFPNYLKGHVRNRLCGPYVSAPPYKYNRTHYLALDTALNLQTEIKTQLHSNTIEYIFELYVNGPYSPEDVADVNELLRDVLNVGTTPVSVYGEPTALTLSKMGEGMYREVIEVPHETVFPDPYTVEIEFPTSGHEMTAELDIPRHTVENDDFNLNRFLVWWWSDLDDNKQLDFIIPEEPYRIKDSGGIPVDESNPAQSDN